MGRNFDGSAANYLDIGDVAAVDITGAYLTLALWVNLADVSSQQKMVGKWGSGQYLFQISGTPQAVVYSGSFDFATAPGALTANRWTHLCMRKNATTSFNVFVDGVNVVAGTAGPPIVDSTNRFRIGQADGGAHPLLNGKTAECAMWDVALTDGEILALAKGIPPTTIRRSSMRGYWPMWGPGVAVEVDQSGGGSHLTLNGVAPRFEHAPVGPFVQPAGYALG